MLKSKYNSFDNLPVVLNMREVANVLGISENSSYELCKKEDFPAFRIGNRILIKRDALVEWIDNQAGKL